MIFGNKKVVSGLITSAIIISLGISVFAASSLNEESGQRGFLSGHKMMGKKGQSLTGALFNNGILTEEETDKINEYLEGNQEGVNFDDLVEDGIFTQERADEIKAQMLRGGIRGKNNEDRFNIAGLVENGIITESEADSISEYLDTFRDEMMTQRQAQGEKIEGMTQEERQEYFKNREKTKIDIFNDLVEEGVISQERADEIEDQILQNREEERAVGKGMPGKISIDKLVQEGIITESEADSISEYLDTFREEMVAQRQAQGEKIEGMTEEERQEYFKNREKTKINIFEKLLEEGIISQDTYDAIEAFKNEL
jgi:uncharacterized protein YutE (UPF0331/DUF86 family)